MVLEFPGHGRATAMSRVKRRAVGNLGDFEGASAEGLGCCEENFAVQ